MYSEKLNKLFEKHHIGLGDVIRVEAKGTAYEGELMPKTEAGNEDTIVVKLQGGYNIGVLYTQKVKVSKIGPGKTTEFPLARPKSMPGLPNVSLLWTGGTIGSKVDYKTGGVNVEVKAEELFYYVPELPKIANITLERIMNIYSEDMSYLEWQKMAEEAANALNRGARGVVIAHGTDIMHYSAAALSFMLKNLNAPVVFTGSQRSGDRGSSDAFLNLAAATRLAAQSDIAEVGICMHSSSSDEKMHFIRGVRARKMHTSRRDAFRPINDRAIAYVGTKGEISYNSSYKKITTTKNKVTAMTKFEPRTAIVKVFPNSDPEIIQYYSDKGYRGLILEGTGLGHIPVSTTQLGRMWIPYVKNAVMDGMVMGITSQCAYGRVNPRVYRNLRLLSDAGAIHCEDMTTETAYVKLGWLLGNYQNFEAKKLLDKNMVGEIGKRTTYDEFLL